MIISKTPFRLSLVGGGSDNISWFEGNGGAILAFTINKYCYITYRHLPPFFKHKNRIVYSNVEHTDSIDEIKHIGIRETLRYLMINDGIEIHHDGDLPARSGIGSSSSFVVGLLNAAYAARGRQVTPRLLALEAYHIEHEMAHEIVGYQDQIMAAYGGLRHVKFFGYDFEVQSHNIPQSRLNDLINHIILVYTGTQRYSSSISASYIKKLDKHYSETKRVCEMVQETINLLCSKTDLKEFGKLLHESWELKKKRGENVSTVEIDGIYEMTRNRGALGGKVLGAGGAGFMIIYVLPEDRQRIELKLSEMGCVVVPFKYEENGSTVIYNDEK